MRVAAAPTISKEWAWKRIQRLRGTMKTRNVHAALIHDPVSAKHLLGTTSMHGWPSVALIEPDRVTAIFFATNEQDAACDEQIVLRGIRHDRAVRHTDELAGALEPALASV